MRKRRNYKSYRSPVNYSIPRAILDILLDLEGPSLFMTPYARMRRSWREMTGAPEPKKWRYNRAIAYLEYRAELEIFEENNRIFLKLTRKGKLRALMLRLYRDFEKKTIWDGKWRLIMWDIPEKSAVERNKIRRLVKDLGFYQLQKSVFITPYPLPDSAVDYLRESELMRYIRFMRVDKMENDAFLKRHFKLK